MLLYDEILKWVVFDEFRNKFHPLLLSIAGILANECSLRNVRYSFYCETTP
jgi:hypothetical protein